MVIYENYSVSTTEFVEKNLLYEKAMKPVYNNKALGVKFTENFSEVWITLFAEDHTRTHDAIR